MTTLQKVYSDIDMTFTRKPVTNDIALRFDIQAVISSIRNLLLTKYYERPFNSSIGSKIYTLLFEPMDIMTARQLEKEIRTTITNFEPRVELQQVVVTPIETKNSYQVSLVFFTENSNQAYNVSILLERTR